MTDKEKVDAYIEKHSQWGEELSTLRSVFQKTELTEEVKWGAPSYSMNGKLVAGIGAFKNHYGIWFHHGVFLKDPHKKLLNAQEGKTRGMRQWRFEKGDVIDTDIVHSYIQESIENSLAGKEIKPERKKTVAIPSELQGAMDANKDLATAYAALTPGKQREYAEHIGEAKREATRQSRLEKCVPMILEGKGLYDKYKNC